LGASHEGSPVEDDALFISVPWSALPRPGVAAVL